MNREPSLVAVQRRLQSFILRDASATSGLVRSDGASDSSERLNIYVIAYRLRLEDALAANFPMLQTHLGGQAFATIALEYIDIHPSSDVSIRSFGQHLADWLEQQRTSEPWLAELARFEWALGCAFDAPDTSTIGIDALAHVAPTDWSMLTFRFSSATQRLTMQTNAATLYASAANDATAPEGRLLPEPCEWLVWRRDLLSQYRSLTTAEALAVDALLAGRTFGETCERLADLDDDETVPMQAASFLKRWISDGQIIDLAVQRA
jgi:hypothetical protein